MHSHITTTMEVRYAGWPVGETDREKPEQLAELSEKVWNSSRCRTCAGPASSSPVRSTELEQLVNGYDRPRSSAATRAGRPSSLARCRL